MKNIEKLSDNELYDLCKQFGSSALMWRRKFESLLPEVEKRQLYKKHKFHSVFEFAAIVGGVSKKTVDEVLRVHRRIEDKPLLRAEIAEKGWAKVRAVTPLLDTASEKDLVNMVQTMPRRAIEFAVREIRRQAGTRNEDAASYDDLNKERNLVNGQSLMNFGCVGEDFEQFEDDETPTGWGKEMAEESQSVLSFRVDGEVEFQLRKLKQAMEKERKEVVSFNEVLKALLGMSGEVVGGEKVEKNNVGSENVCDSEEILEQVGANLVRLKVREELIGFACFEGRCSPKKASKRYIPVAERRANDQKYKGKCSYPNCNRPHEVIHHQERFALVKNHEKIVPLCKTHHQIVHSGLIVNENQVPENWRVTATVDKDSLKYSVDQKFQRFQEFQM